jgi:uncharacterized small protein (DUF1192 family)
VSPDEKPQKARAGDKMRSEDKVKERVAIGSPEWYAELNRRMTLLEKNIAHLEQEHKERFRENDEQNKRINKLQDTMDRIAQDPFMQHITKVNAFNENKRLILSKLESHT